MYEVIIMGIGESIKNIRIQRKMTQKELGEKLGGISQQQIGRWENGKANPKLDTIQKIAAALEVPFANLLGAMYNEKNSAALEKFYYGSPDAESITSEQITEFYNALVANEPIRKAWVIEKEKWALQEISKYLKKLNPAGQDEAVARIEELTHSPRFKNLFDDDEPLKK